MTDKTGQKKIVRHESGKNLSEIIKNVATILALVIGGYWTYSRFLRVDAPSLEPRGTANSTIFWNDLGNGKCEAVFDVDFANSGHTSFNIIRLEVQAWKFQRAWVSGQFAFLDTDEVKNGKPAFGKIYSEFPAGGGIHMFIGHYPPGATFRHSFVFLVSKAQDQVSKDQDESVYFEARYYMKDGAQPHAYTGTWDTVCNFRKPALSPSPSPTPQ